MSAAWRVSEVRVIEDYAVWVRFKDGLEGVMRFLPGFFRGVFSHLYAREPSVDNNPIRILRVGALQLKQEGFYQSANVVEFLVDFLASRPKAHIDPSPVNFMMDAHRNLIFIDPISS